VWRVVSSNGQSVRTAFFWAAAEHVVGLRVLSTHVGLHLILLYCATRAPEVEYYEFCVVSAAYGITEEDSERRVLLLRSSQPTGTIGRCLLEAAHPVSAFRSPTARFPNIAEKAFSAVRRRSRDALSRGSRGGSHQAAKGQVWFARYGFSDPRPKIDALKRACPTYPSSLKPR